MRRRKETEHEILTGTIEGWDKEVDFSENTLQFYLKFCWDPQFSSLHASRLLRDYLHDYEVLSLHNTNYKYEN